MSTGVDTPSSSLAGPGCAVGLGSTTIEGLGAGLALGAVDGSRDAEGEGDGEGSRLGSGVGVAGTGVGVGTGVGTGVGLGFGVGLGGIGVTWRLTARSGLMSGDPSEARYENPSLPVNPAVGV
jgi:hypothetical protein